MKLILPGEPISQIRMKYSGRNGIGRIYDPREKAKRELKKVIADKFGDHPVFRHPRISFIFHMHIPVSTPKKLVYIYRSGFLKHQKKPDTDNLIKLYLDCMDPIMFDGDQRVTLGPCIKLYHPVPKTIIIINETAEVLSQQEVDQETWHALSEKEYDRYSSSGMAYLDDSCNQVGLGH